MIPKEKNTFAQIKEQAYTNFAAKPFCKANNSQKHLWADRAWMLRCAGADKTPESLNKQAHSSIDHKASVTSNCSLNPTMAIKNYN